MQKETSQVQSPTPKAPKSLSESCPTGSHSKGLFASNIPSKKSVAGGLGLSRCCVIAVLVVLASVTSVRAEDRGAERSPDAIEDTSRQVRLRLYPGGADEQDIQVQRSIPSPARGSVETTVTSESSD